MHTYQIADTVLDNYRKGKLGEERIRFLKEQVHEQMNELVQHEALYARFLQKIDLPEPIDEVVLWMMIMMDEDRVDDYINACKKNFREIIPVSDLADLLLYAVHLKKVQNTTLEGFDYFLEFQHDGKDEVDQFCFMNVLLYVQKSKEVEMEF